MAFKEVGGGEIGERAEEKRGVVPSSLSCQV
jgi:hypothetical protein